MGYNQMAPGRDAPRMNPLQRAIAPGVGTPPGGAPTSYPSDPSMMSWRQGHQPRRIQPAMPGGQPSEPTMGGGSQDPTAFIHQWQNQHPVNGGMQPLLEAMHAQGFNVAPYMYGGNQSHNEISLNGSKFKVISGEDSANPSWYQGGYDGPPQGHMHAMAGIGGAAPLLSAIIQRNTQGSTSDQMAPDFMQMLQSLSQL